MQIGKQKIADGGIYKKKNIYYNMLNKRAVGQLLPDRRHVKLTKSSALVYQTGALLFACNVNDKSYNSAKHHYKLE